MYRSSLWFANDVMNEAIKERQSGGPAGNEETGRRNPTSEVQVESVT